MPRHTIMRCLGALAAGRDFPAQAWRIATRIAQMVRLHADIAPQVAREKAHVLLTQAGILDVGQLCAYISRPCTRMLIDAAPVSDPKVEARRHLRLAAGSGNDGRTSNDPDRPTGRMKEVSAGYYMAAITWRPEQA